MGRRGVLVAAADAAPLAVTGGALMLRCHGSGDGPRAPRCLNNGLLAVWRMLVRYSVGAGTVLEKRNGDVRRGKFRIIIIIIIKITSPYSNKEFSNERYMVTKLTIFCASAADFF